MLKVKGNLLTVLCMAIFVFAAIFVETSFGAENVTFNLSATEGNVFALVRPQSDGIVNIKNAEVEHFTVQTAKDEDTNQRDKIDIYLIKTAATPAEIVLPEGEYSLWELYDPRGKDSYSPGRFYNIGVSDTGELTDPISKIEGEFDEATKTLKPRTMKDFDFDLSEMGVTDGANYVTYVQNDQGDFVGDVIVNLEKENAQGTYDIVERAVTSSSGMAFFQTVIEPGDTAKYRYCVTDSSEYVAPVHSEFLDYSCKSLINRIRKGKEIYYLYDYDTAEYAFGETGDLNAIKAVFQSRIPQLTPTGYVGLVADSEQISELSIKNYNSEIEELRAQFRIIKTRQAPIVLKRLPEKKVSISKTNGEGKELGGATLELYKIVKTLQNGSVVEKETLVEAWKTTREKKDFSLQTGSYVLKEKEAPKGYVLAEDINFTVSDDGITVNGKSLNAGENTVVMVDNYDEQTEGENGIAKDKKKDKTKDKDEVTNTGDESSILPEEVLLMASALVAIGVIILGRRKNVRCNK